MRRFRYEYGAGPVHLLVVLASFAVVAYALARAFGELSDPLRFLVWLGGAALAHDLVLFPLYSLLALIVYRGSGSRRMPADRLRLAALNHLRVPVFFSGLLLLVWFPLVLRTGDRTFTNATGLSNDVYLERWLLLSAALFVGSALLFAVRVRRLRSVAETPLSPTSP